MEISSLFLKGAYLAGFHDEKVHVWYRQSPSAEVQEIDGSFYWSDKYLDWSVIDIYNGMKCSSEIVKIDFVNLPSMSELIQGKSSLSGLDSLII
jgi:hypothetical protein